MGGRGGTSGLSSQSTIQSFLKAGIRFDDMDNLNKTAVEQSLSGFRDVLHDMGIPLSAINMISGTDEKGEIMGVNGFNDLVFSKRVYSSLDKAKENSESRNGYFVTNGLYGTGAHEAGHLIINEIINKTMKGSSVLEKAKARKSYKIEKQIIREAKKTYGSSPQISGYGQTKPSETIAEAVADVYTNKSKANPYSRVIVDIMKKKLKGK